jgi:hypothetical protein
MLRLYIHFRRCLLLLPVVYLNEYGYAMLREQKSKRTTIAGILFLRESLMLNDF